MTVIRVQPFNVINITFIVLYIIHENSGNVMIKKYIAKQD